MSDRKQEKLWEAETYSGWGHVDDFDVVAVGFHEFSGNGCRENQKVNGTCDKSRSSGSNLPSSRMTVLPAPVGAETTKFLSVLNAESKH